MGYLETKSFETSLKKVLANWGQKIKATLQQIEKIKSEVDKLTAKKDRTPEEEKRLGLCEAALVKLKKKMEAEALSLKTNLIVLTPPPNATPSDLAKIKKIVKDALAKLEKGLPLGGGWRLKHDVAIDFKKLKFKKFGVILEWTF